MSDIVFGMMEGAIALQSKEIASEEDYHPEMALSLEYPPEVYSLEAFQAALQEALAELEEAKSARKVQIRETIREKLCQHGFDRNSFGRAAMARFQGTTNFSKFLKKHVDRFLNKGMGSHFHLRVFGEMLSLTREDLFRGSPEIQAASRKLDELRSSMTVSFPGEFPLIWKYRDGIRNTPELANILPVPEHLGACFAYVAPPRLTLGAFLDLYSQGKLRLGECPDCHKTILGTYFCGSPLSGSGSSVGFCVGCGKSIWREGLDRQAFRAFMGYRRPFPLEATPWTMKALVTALRKLEGADESHGDGQSHPE